MTEAAVSPDFWLAGQLRIRQDGEIKILGPTLLHEILALLVLRANTPVPVSTIAVSVWPDRDPPDEESVRPYVSRIRRLLDGTGCHVRTLSRRYLLEVDPTRVDVLRFNLLMDHADNADDPMQRRLVLEALDVCPTDNLLSGFTRAWAHVARTEHRSKWNAAALRRNRYWLRDGLHERLLAAMRVESAHRSTDQRVAEDYLQALYRSGHVEEAISHFDGLSRLLQTRRTPMLERLRRLGEAIRRQDPALDQPNARPFVAAPDTLPAPTGCLAGRQGETNAIRAHADAGGHDTVRVAGIYGPPGIGKTALATTYAHRHKGRYPGGVLFGQFGAYGTPGDLDQVLESFLAALGVSRDNLPPERSARLARYRDLVRRRSMLVVLDNVWASEEAAALLPTGPGSLAIVTSRNRLTTMTSRHGALPVVLGRIDESAAVTLLNRLIGGRAEHALAVVTDIARACGGHPLALCLAGARVATRPEEPLLAVAMAIAEPGQRIPTLDRYAESGDAVADVFGWSYRSLNPLRAEVFRTLGLSPSTSLDLAAAAHLTGHDEETLRGALSDLSAAHLITTIGTDRFGMLDLLAEYAAALAVDVDPPQARQSALDRLYAHHHDAARAAAHCLWPLEVAQRSAAYRFDDPEAARQWLDDHREELLGAARHEAASARPGHIVDLAECLFRYLDHGGHLDQATTLNSDAVDAARSLGNDVETARALGRLGAVLVRRGQYAGAEATLAAAHAMYDQLGDARGQAVVLGNLGRVAARRGSFAVAEAHQRAALELFRTARDRLGEARTLTNLGIVCETRGDQASGLEHLVAARAICAEIDAPDALARAMGCIADVLRAQGRLGEAYDQYAQALDQFRALGDRLGDATTLANLGLVMSERGRHGEACRLNEEALEIFTEIGDEDSAVEALNNVGAALFAAGRPSAALQRHLEALRRADEAGNRHEAARAGACLAAVYAHRADHATGVARDDAVASARQYVIEAAHRYREIDIEVPPQLAALAEQLGPI